MPAIIRHGYATVHDTLKVEAVLNTFYTGTEFIGGQCYLHIRADGEVLASIHESDVTPRAYLAALAAAINAVENPALAVEVAA